jgi:hypothetical protein
MLLSDLPDEAELERGTPAKFNTCVLERFPSGITSGSVLSITSGIARSIMTEEKVRENRLRRMAQRRGYMLVKSRRRDPLATDYGLYVLVGDSKGNRVGRHGGRAAVSAFAKGEGMDLDGIEAELEGLGHRGEQR